MGCRVVGMLGRMPILRVIAAADMPAGPAQARVHPSVSELACTAVLYLPRATSGPLLSEQFPDGPVSLIDR